MLQPTGEACLLLPTVVYFSVIYEPYLLFLAIAFCPLLVHVPCIHPLPSVTYCCLLLSGCLQAYFRCPVI